MLNAWSLAARGGPGPGCRLLCVDSQLALLVNHGAAGSRGPAGSETQASPSEVAFQRSEVRGAPFHCYDGHLVLK